MAWDNRGTAHCAVDDWADRWRVRHRITLRDDVPIGVEPRRARGGRREHLISATHAFGRPEPGIRGARARSGPLEPACVLSANGNTNQENRHSSVE